MRAGYRRACGAAGHASVHGRSSRLTGAIRANQWQSYAISGNQWAWPQLKFRGGHQSQSYAISFNQWQSAATHVSQTVPDPFHSLRASFLVSSSSATLSSSSRGPWKASALAIASRRKNSANFSDLSTLSAPRGKGAAKGGWVEARVETRHLAARMRRRLRRRLRFNRWVGYDAERAAREIGWGTGDGGGMLGVGGMRFVALSPPSPATRPARKGEPKQRRCARTRGSALGQLGIRRQPFRPLILPFRPLEVR